MVCRAPKIYKTDSGFTPELWCWLTLRLLFQDPICKYRWGLVFFLLKFCKKLRNIAVRRHECPLPRAILLGVLCVQNRRLQIGSRQIADAPNRTGFVLVLQHRLLTGRNKFLCIHIFSLQAVTRTGFPYSVHSSSSPSIIFQVSSVFGVSLWYTRGICS